MWKLQKKFARQVARHVKMLESAPKRARKLTNKINQQAHPMRKLQKKSARQVAKNVKMLVSAPKRVCKLTNKIE